MSAMKNTTPTMGRRKLRRARAGFVFEAPGGDLEQPVVAHQDAKPGGERDHDREHRDDAERDDDLEREPLADVERQSGQQLVIRDSGPRPSGSR